MFEQIYAFKINSNASYTMMMVNVCHAGIEKKK